VLILRTLSAVCSRSPAWICTAVIARGSSMVTPQRQQRPLSKDTAREQHGQAKPLIWPSTPPMPPPPPPPPPAAAAAAQQQRAQLQLKQCEARRLCWRAALGR
jgi:hypothetical protein